MTPRTANRVAAGLAVLLIVLMMTAIYAYAMAIARTLEKPDPVIILKVRDAETREWRTVDLPKGPIGVPAWAEFGDPVDRVEITLEVPDE